MTFGRQIGIGFARRRRFRSLGRPHVARGICGDGPPLSREEWKQARKNETARETPRIMNLLEKLRTAASAPGSLGFD